MIDVNMLTQCNIGGTVLHICDTVGTRAVHTLRYPVCRLCYFAECHRMYLGRTDLLSAVCRGLSMVVEIHLQCWVCLICPVAQLMQREHANNGY